MRLKSFKFLIIALTFFVGFGNTQAQEVAMDEMLDMDLSELMNVPIVIASKKSEGSFTAPLSTTVLSREEIEKSGVTSIEEAFRLVPGMFVRQRTNGNFDVHIRGNDNVPPQNYTMYSENTTTLVMVNGRKVFNYSNGGVLWETLPVSLNDIERIEIIRGPSTAMYGPNAMSGVINIVTVTPKDETLAVTGTEQFGTENTGIYNIAVSSSQLDNKLKLRVGGNYENRDRATTDYYNWVQGKYVPRENLLEYSGAPIGNPKNYEDPTLGKERAGVVGSVGYDFTSDANLVVEGGYQKSSAQSVFMETQETPLSTRSTESYFVNTTAKFKGLELNVANTQGYQDMYEGNPSAEIDYNIIDATAEYNLELGTLSLRPGVSYQRAMYSDLDYAGANNSGYLNASRALTTAAYYLRGDYRATDRLRLIGAVRLDDYNMPNTTYLSYQLSGTYSINENNFLRASYGKANKGPVMVDSYVDFNAGDGVYYMGNPDLALTFNNTAELGYRWMAMRNLSFDAEVYYSVTNEFTVFTPLSVSPTTGVVFSYDELDLSSSILGGALSVNYILSSKSQIKIWGGYSNTQLTDYDEKKTPLLPPSAQVPTGALPTYERKDIQNPQTPKFYGGASLTLQPIEKLSANLDCYFLGAHEYIHDYDAYAKFFSSMNPAFTGSGRTNVDANLTVNFKVGYEIYKHNQIFVNCRNFLSNEKQEFGFADPIGAAYLVGVKIDL